MNDLRRIEKEIQEKQRLAPSFFKNPYRPTARLLKQVRRQANFIKTTSHSKYEEMIDKVMQRSPRQSRIKEPPTQEQILDNIIQELKKEIEQKKANLSPTFCLRRREHFDQHDKILTLKTLISHIHNEQAIRNRQPQSKFPCIQLESNSCDSDRVMSIISACSKQNNQLEKMHKFVNQKQRNQRKRFASLHDQIGLLYLLE
ncbi:unnamed protein product (macronuclear) [Paramecium tetraurelia]|uniref:Uncharacterized protein n=1 Tax=Paramecium tetraurelia TaxID=5888 RepID=A0DZM8_PARTE|nr:uncharacterized protein GSPATT00021663001 [Paramecium tetraurelia]CAK88495.1 unnamed protein product [Paramecium tetraurelia]|eukprot:XP_001455892.1 hypothetical protein (macronuclear) [Paramecium tetraurelia strain d4-2]